MKRQFVVTIDVPDNVTMTMVRDYIRDAVASWSGQLLPPGVDADYPDGDPLWGVGKRATVKSIKQEK